MEQERIERDGIRLKNFESFILEIVLLAYPLLLISEKVLVAPHYLIIIFAIVAGIGSSILFSRISYSVLIGLGISFLIAIPFYLLGMPLIIFVILFVYVFWRMHTNFGLDRLVRWNFLLINTVTLTIFYFITKSYLLKAHAAEVNKVNIIMFLMTTVLFIVLRYVVILLVGKRLPDFQFGEASKVFGALIGLGIATYLIIYFFIEYVRDAVITVFAFLFGGLFMMLAAAVTPFIDWAIEYRDYLKYRNYQEMKVPDFILEDGRMDEIRTISGPFESSIGVFISVSVLLIAIVILIVILRKRKLVSVSTEPSIFSVRSFGRKKKEVELEPAYDYSMATNAVRSAYQNFENEATAASYSRFSGETVKEWFRRMGWAQNENVFGTYDKARYGSNSITEEEGRQFVKELQNIKTDFFTKN